MCARMEVCVCAWKCVFVHGSENVFACMSLSVCVRACVQEGVCLFMFRMTRTAKQ